MLFIQLKHIALTVEPNLGFNITDMCLLLIILNFIILTFLIKKIGKKLKFPNGPILFISLINLLLIADRDIFISH